jgi:SAM-dependent methyltransferase
VQLAWAWGVLTTTRYPRLHGWLRVEVAQTQPDGAVFDVGCGTGALLAPWVMRMPHLRWTGIDRDAEALTALGQYLSDRRCTSARLLQLDINAPSIRVPQVSGGYSLVICVAMLQYVAEPAALLAQLSASLRPGGVVLLYVPVGYHRLLPGFDALIARYFSKVDYDKQQTIRHRFTKEQVERLIVSAGLTITHREHVTGWPGQVQYELHTLLFYATRAWLWPLPALIAFLPVGLLLIGLDRIHGRLYPQRRANGLLAKLERVD